MEYKISNLKLNGVVYPDCVLIMEGSTGRNEIILSFSNEVKVNELASELSFDSVIDATFNIDERSCKVDCVLASAVNKEALLAICGPITIIE